MTANSADNSYSVSVVIPAYNAEKCIERTVNSVLAQTLMPDKIIVVDDGSTDGTANVLAKYGDKIKYIYQENAGVSAARNTGIEAANSEWIAFVDADDEWLEDKLELQNELLKRNPELVWVSANFMRCLCDEGRSGPTVDPQKTKQTLAGKDYHEEFFVACKANTAGWTGTMMVKRNVLIEAGLFPEGLAVAEDIDLWFRIAYRYPQIGHVPEPLAIYHMSTPQSLTKSFRNMDIQAEFIKRHLTIAAEHGRGDALKPCAAHMVTSWIRSLLFNNHPEQVHKFLADFGELLSPFYKALFRILMISPRTTAWTCHLISKIVRKLNLRKKIISRPQKPKPRTE